MIDTHETARRPAGGTHGAQVRPARRKTTKVIVSLIAGGLAGGLATGVLLAFVDRGLFGQLDAHHEVAMLVALVYVVTGLFVAIGVARPAIGARFLNVEDAEEIAEHRRMHAYSCIGMIAIGLLLALAALARPLAIDPAIALAGCAALMTAFIAASWRQRRLIDELLAALSRETAALAFYLLALAGGSWSLLAVLGYAPAPIPLDWLTMIAATLLLAAFGASFARGMLTPR
ncbi:MAG: hypothetical protein GW859_04970 [Sphingomonadales bacterium]|nr:hypothetical protein [Sphingomonadales bacterium]